MFKGLDHVVLAVKDLDASIAQFEKVYGIQATDRGEPQGAGFTNAYFRFGGSSYVELVSPTNENGPVGKRVAASGDGVYLLALAVDNLEETLNDLRGKGVRLVGDPGPGQPVKGQVFIHPSAAGGVLTQLVQR
jgi:methylmalonyl-CoA epimerase